jgi:hypothetical protein
MLCEEHVVTTLVGKVVLIVRMSRAAPESS